MTEPLMLADLAGEGNHCFKVETAFAAEKGRSGYDCDLRLEAWGMLVLGKSLLGNGSRRFAVGTKVSDGWGCL